MNLLPKISAILTTTLSLFLFSSTNTYAATLSVPAQYSTIQSAITAAATGDTILVSPGTYAGATLNKGVILRATTFDQANPRNNTTILTTAGSAVITIPTNVSGNPQIIGFKLQASGGSGILTNSPLTVEYNWFAGADDQAEYEVGSGGINRGNVYTGAGDDCIDLDEQTQNLLIENNLCLNPPDDGIEMRFQDSPNPPSKITVTVRGNRIEGAKRDGFQFIDYNADTNRKVIFEKNLFLNNVVAGIGFLCCATTSHSLDSPASHSMREEAQIINNTFIGNGYGISGGANALVLNNIFLNSPRTALLNLTSSSYVSHNVFFGNTTNSAGTNNNNAFQGNPLLNTSYIPQSGSIAIDAGLNAYTWNSLFGSVNFAIPIGQYSGGAPDVGWIETGLTQSTPTPGPTSTPVPTQLPTPTINGFQIIRVVPAVSDDAEENTATGVVATNSTDIELVTDGSITQTVGLRFDSISIPKDANIKSAYLEFTADEAQSDATSLTFFAHAADNSPTFTTSSNNISSRPKTTASVAWNSIPAWTIGNTYKSPDLSSIVQQIVTRPLWSNGNAMSFIVTGSGHRTSVAFDGDNGAAAKLVIVYDTSSPVPSSATPTPICTTTLPTTTGTASTSINLSAGTYRVWSRIMAPDSTNNSFYLQVDNQCPIVVGDSSSVAPNTWTWINYKDGNTSSFVDVTVTSGDHIIKMVGKEQNVKLDKLVLTTDTSCTPTGTGNNCSTLPSITISPSGSPTGTPKTGDYNSDTNVDLLDFNLWRSEFLSLLTSKLSDSNKDNVIDLLDFNSWLNAFRSAT